MIVASWFLWKKENPYEYKKIKILIQMYRETNTGKIVIIITSFYVTQNLYVQEFTKKAAQNSIK